jgi:hypothetical protein
MPSQPSRRDLLSAVGVSLVGLAGCLDGGGPGSGTGTPTPTGSPPPTDTPSKTPRESPTETSTTPTEVDRTDDFYVENFDGREYAFEISLVSDGGEAVVDGRYRVPSGVALRWAAVGVEGTTYEVSVAFETGESLTEEWAVDDCPNVYEGDRNGAVQLREGTPEYRQNECDAIAVGYDLPRADAEQYRLD